MRKAICKSLVIGIVVLGLVGITNNGFAEEDIKIGVILPLSGSLAPIGLDVRTGLDLAVKLINKEGGVKSLGGAKFRLIYSDSTGVPEVGTSEAERLVVREKVDALMGAYQSSVTFPSTMIAEKYKVPYIVVIAVRDDIVIGRGYNYVFRASVSSTMQAQSTVDFITDMNKLHSRKAKRVAVIYENSDFGQFVSLGIKKLIKDTDLEVVLDESYPTEMTDFSALVSKIKTAKVDVIIRTQYVSDAILFAKAIGEQKVDVMAIVGPGGGETNPTYIPAVGKYGKYHFTNPAYTPTLPIALPWLKPVNEVFKAEYNRDITTDAVHGIFDLYLLKDAFERAKSRDHKKVRDAIAATNIKADKLPWFLFPFEGVKFDKDGQNIYAVPTVSQILGKELELYAVWPEKYQVKGHKLVWPMPTWAEREKSE